jgi:hypothetical protein
VENQPNLTTFLRILNSIRDDGALEKNDWLILLPIMVRLVNQLREQTKSKPFFYIALAGAEKVLSEILEHLEEVK